LVIRTFVGKAPRHLLANRFRIPKDVVNFNRERMGDLRTGCSGRMPALIFISGCDIMRPPPE
jgi:hypothetical protein